MNRRSLFTSYNFDPLASLRLQEGNGKGKTTSAAGPRANYFPNVELLTHENKTVRFYDDLVRGDKIVMFNFMYAKCEGICMPVTMNLVKVRNILGDRVGRDIFMYSITLEPEQDTPAVLKQYAEAHGVKPGSGWTFLTGKRDDIQKLRRKLGFVDPDPVFDADKKQHIGLVRFGNESLDRWAASPAIASPKQIAKAVLWMEGPNKLKQNHIPGDDKLREPAHDHHKH